MHRESSNHVGAKRSRQRVEPDLEVSRDLGTSICFWLSWRALCYDANQSGSSLSPCFKLFTGPSNSGLLGPLPQVKIKFFAACGLARASEKGKSKGGRDSLYCPSNIVCRFGRLPADQRLHLLSMALTPASHAFRCSR
jgi:hypothetical protein